MKKKKSFYNSASDEESMRMHLEEREENTGRKRCVIWYAAVLRGGLVHGCWEPCRPGWEF